MPVSRKIAEELGVREGQVTARKRISLTLRLDDFPERSGASGARPAQRPTPTSR